MGGDGEWRLSDVRANLIDGRLGEALETFKDLLAGQKRAFLLGAGCSKVAGLPLTTELTESVLDAGAVSDDTRARLYSDIPASFAGQDGVAGIEDYLSELVDDAAIADRRKLRGAEKNKVRLGEGEYDSDALHVAISESSAALLAPSAMQTSLSRRIANSFVRSIARSVLDGTHRGKPWTTWY